MQRRFTKEFEEEAVRLVQTSGRTQREIPGDLRDRAVDAGPLDQPEPGSGCCRSDEGGRGRCHGGAETAAPGERGPPPGAGHPEEGDGFFRPGGKSMRFALIDTAKAEFPIPSMRRTRRQPKRLFCLARSAGVPPQRDDMVLLAHVRSAFALSNGTYGSPRMTRELRDSGLTVGVAGRPV